MIKNTHKIFLLLLLMVLLLPMMSQTVTASVITQPKTPSGIPYSGLEQRINSYIMENEKTTASVALEIFEGQKTLYRTVAGYTNLEEKIKATEDTVYEWGSVSKLLVWTSVMQLWEQGRLDLEEDIRTYLPKGFLTKLKYDTPITMMNLMNHTAGWQETVYEIQTAERSRVVDLKEALKQSEPSQIYEPGSVCAYSNWGCALAGFIVECITGQPFYAYVKSHIFEPLGMEHTAFAADLSDNPWVYNQRKKQKSYYITEKDFIDLDTCLYYILLYPAGMATGTLEDFTSFAKTFLSTEREGSPLFEKKDTLDIMLSPTLFYGNTDIPRASHGFWHLDFGVRTLGHGGNTSGGSSHFLFDPLSEIGITVMTNQQGERIYNYGIPALIFGEYEDKVTASLQQVERLDGIYTCSRTLKNGFVSFYDMMSALILKASNEATNRFDILFEEGSVTQVMGNNLIADLEGSKLYLYKHTSDKGEISLQTMSMDFIKQNTAAFLAKAALILLLLLGFAYSTICLLLELITLLIRKVRKQKGTPQPMKKYRIFTHLSIVSFGVILISILTGSVFTVGNMWWRCVLNALLALVPVVYTIILLINRHLIQSSKRVKFYNFLTAFMGLIMTINIILWQMYNFWS